MSKAWGPIVPRQRVGTAGDMLAQEIQRYSEALHRIGSRQTQLWIESEWLRHDGEHKAAELMFNRQILTLARRQGKVMGRIQHASCQMAALVARVTEERDELAAVAGAAACPF